MKALLILKTVIAHLSKNTYGFMIIPLDWAKVYIAFSGPIPCIQLAPSSIMLSSSPNCTV